MHQSHKKQLSSRFLVLKIGVVSAQYLTIGSSLQTLVPLFILSCRQVHVWPGTNLDTSAWGKKKSTQGAERTDAAHVNLKAKHLWASAEGLVFTLIRAVRDLTVQWPPVHRTEVNHTDEEKNPHFIRENPRLCFCS